MIMRYVDLPFWNGKKSNAWLDFFGVTSQGPLSSFKNRQEELEALAE